MSSSSVGSAVRSVKNVVHTLWEGAGKSVALYAKVKGHSTQTGMSKIAYAGSSSVHIDDIFTVYAI